MSETPKVCELKLPVKVLLDGTEDPQTLPQFEPSHSSDEIEATAETLENDR